MKILQLVFHPDLSQSRVNAAWFNQGREAQFTTIDLYGTYPDFKIDVLKEQKQLLEHDRIVLQFPFHWYGAPSLTKKWIDEVFTYGFAFGGPHSFQLAGKEVMVCISTGGSAESYTSQGSNRFSIEEFLRPFEQLATHCQMQYLKPFVFNGAMAATSEDIEASSKRLIRHLSEPTSQRFSDFSLV